MRLVLCSACQRHLRDDATTCPFCGRPNDATPGAPERVARLGRAALMAFGVAATAVSGEGCAKESDNIAQPYGAPPNPTPTPTVQDAAPTPPPQDTAPAPPPAVDAASPGPVDAGAPKDAAAPKKDASVAVSPPPTATDLRNLKKPYGAPPIPWGDDYV